MQPSDEARPYPARFRYLEGFRLDTAAVTPRGEGSGGQVLNLMQKIGSYGVIQAGTHYVTQSPPKTSTEKYRRVAADLWVMS